MHLMNIKPRRKDLGKDLREAIFAAHQSGKDYKAISNNLKGIIHRWKTFKTAGNLPRSGHPSKFTPRSLVHDSTRSKTLNKYGVLGTVNRRKLLLFKNNLAAWLLLVNLHLNKPQDFWNTKGEMFDQNTQHYVWRKPNTEYPHKFSYQLSGTVVEGWWFALVLQPQSLGTFTVIEWTKRSFVYHSILESNVRPSTHSSKSTTPQISINWSIVIE